MTNNIHGSSNASPPSSSDLHYNPGRHDSNTSFLSPSISAKSYREEYLSTLIPPTPEMVERIARVQQQKEEEIMRKRAQEISAMDERAAAAGLIQRNYRGHRERRMLDGMSLDPSTRWVEAVKEARYRNLTEPRARGRSLEGDGSGNGNGGEGGGGRQNSVAMSNWKKVGLITRRAGGDEDSDEEKSDVESSTGEDKEERRKRKIEKKMERQKAAKILDLTYFLEMVDLKHRYGSNLRTYHAEWKKSDTKENFFYWLDYGEGRFLDCMGCPREKLDREQVRYLSKEERMHYLVKIDKEGRLCWAKNGARIDTTERFKDSIHGIVPDTDETPAYKPALGEAARSHSHSHSSNMGHTPTTSSSSSESGEESASADKSALPLSDGPKAMKKVKHVSAATIFNKLLRGSVKNNTWIFVVDTSFRLYVGIKQSGAFQHSSFLNGSRISAAGSIKIKNGRLVKLSPLSGHYRPPVSNFRAFVHSMKESGADMSHVSISRSYAVLVGLEAYVKTRRRGKKMIQKLIHGRDKVLSPAELAEHEDAKRDRTESVAREQRLLELKQQAEEKEMEDNRATAKLMDKLHIKPHTPVHEEAMKEKEVSRKEKGEMGEMKS